MAWKKTAMEMMEFIKAYCELIQRYMPNKAAEGRKVMEGTVKNVIESSPYDNLEEAYLWYMGEEVTR